MSKDIYDSKVILIDIDFLSIDQYGIDDYLYIKKLLIEISANQNLVILTNNTCVAAKKVINDMGLKTGFLISDGGAIITSIATKKPIEVTALQTEQINRIWHKCLWKNLNFSMNNEDQIYPYILNCWLIRRYKANLNYLYEHANNALNKSSIAYEYSKTKKIVSLEVFFLEKTDEQKEEKMNKFKNELGLNEFNYCKNAASINIVNKTVCKSSAIEKLVNKFNWNIKNNNIYCGINQIDKKVLANSYFAIVSQEFKNEVDLKKNNQLEILEWGNISWVKWFKNNQQLWKGNWEEVLKKILSKKKDKLAYKKDYSYLRNNKDKYLQLDSCFKLGLWPEQVDETIKIIEKIS